jgi:hypothetical protein
MQHVDRRSTAARRLLQGALLRVLHIAQLCIYIGVYIFCFSTLQDIVLHVSDSLGIVCIAGKRLV